MDWSEWQAAKKLVLEGWVVNEADQTLHDPQGNLVLVWSGEKAMFRALVADAVNLYAISPTAPEGGE